MKHTPAPWIARHIPADEPDVRFSLWVDSSTGAPLADVRTRPDNEHEANARLIAAAPDYYAIVDAILEDDTLTAEHIRNMLRPAHAKAQA